MDQKRRNELNQEIVEILSQNKIAIITGGSRSIGRDAILSLAKRGVNSIFTLS